jgi:hypothetical protein
MAEAPKPVTLTDEERAQHKRLVDKVVSDRLTEWSDAIKATTIPDLPKPGLSRKIYLLVCLIAPVPLLIAIIIKWVLFLYFGESIDASPRLMEIHHQIAVLAFVVALAAYLSNVSREILKITREIEISKTAIRIIERNRKSIAWITEAEIHLVLLGVLASLRLILGPYWRSITGYNVGAMDNFLLIYLTVIVVNLALLHMRQWWIHESFKAVVE